MAPEKHANIREARIQTAQLELLEKLSNASGVSGNEDEVRSIVLDAIRPLADDIRVDALGNVLATRTGKANKRLRVMLAAHMDEVGFILTHDHGEGLFQFETVGGIDIRQIIGKPVLVGTEHVPGVIGARAIHLTTAAERRKAIPLDTLRIDIGLGDSKKVKAGDRAVFATRFAQTGPSLAGKALDNRLGVATLIELCRLAPDEVDLLLAFTTQEEIGARGAQVAAFSFHPDLAIAVDSTPANDLPAWEEDDENFTYNTHLGAGPAIYAMDRGTISDPRLLRFLTHTAETDRIPYQIRQPGGGGTDASVIHRQLEGIPSISVSIPGRYAHTPVGLARLSDWENTLRLLFSAMQKITPGVIAR
jgi:tetrahedral aminopeptidase